MGAGTSNGFEGLDGSTLLRDWTLLLSCLYNFMHLLSFLQLRSAGAIRRFARSCTNTAGRSHSQVVRSSATKSQSRPRSTW